MYENWKEHSRSSYGRNMVQFRPLIPELRHFENIGMHHFSLIGCHLETVSRTEPVFELNLAPSEEKPTYEFRSDWAIFIKLCVNVTSCNLCARAKLPGHRELRRTETPGMLAQNALTRGRFETPTCRSTGDHTNHHTTTAHIKIF